MVHTGTTDRVGAASGDLPRGFHQLIAAQFASALADNALLLVAVAYIWQQGHPAWWAPLLKLSFTLAYVVLAPLAGPVADGMPKARLMAWMNATKAAGVVMLGLGLNPLLAFAVVGLGSAGYAPAKYGLVTELIGPHQLVRANAWIEVSVVGAVLIGTATGGLLVSDSLANWLPYAQLASALQSPAWANGSALGTAFGVVLLLYGAGSLLNVGLPDSGRRYARQAIHPLQLVRQFAVANRTLWRDPKGGCMSLSVTTIFWGVGAVLQFAVLRHATDVLGLSLAQGSALQATVAIGVVAGAVVAARRVQLHAVPRMLPMGVLFGLLVACGAWADSLWVAMLLMALIGAAGGLLVVPMNALLQHRGYELLTAGRSIAVQGFNENASILVMLAAYSLLVRADLSSPAIMVSLGLALAGLMALLWRAQRAPQFISG